MSAKRGSWQLCYVTEVLIVPIDKCRADQKEQSGSDYQRDIVKR
jgi:hypothetical protein